MTIHYTPQEIEPKWRKFWEEQGLFQMKEHSKKPKFYLLMMFPYPSGTLHVGHARNYIIGDTVHRYKVMRGFNVLNPMGWDAFGLPAENAAVKGGLHPRVSTLRNITRMKEQLKEWGTSYDWNHELASCDPIYYRWTQWLFLKFYEKGLVYKKKSPANWCTGCLTTIANEQVVESAGKEVCERCGNTVVQKDLEQWFFRITQYAERLVSDLDLLPGWPEHVKLRQKNWIGVSHGSEVFFKVAETGSALPCFTTRPDTLWGVTFMSLAPEHPIIPSLVAGTPKEKEVMEFVAKNRQIRAADRANITKEGIFTGKHVINPVTGAKVELWVANYALMEYGTGAVMAVPAHDQRDFEFARKYNIPITVVILPPSGKLEAADMKTAYAEPGTLVNSGPFSGQKSDAAIPGIIEYLAKNSLGKDAVHYRLRDWNISRQRYWGCPIPMIYCDKCGIVPVPEGNLPVLLPEDVEDYKPKGKSVLAGVPAFVNTTCPNCGAAATRETDTMDTFVDSSWYFLRYLSPQDDKKAIHGKLVNKWLPVDQYVGGAEHATKHLIYARFFTKVLHDMGLLTFNEPFQNLFTQGMICKESYWQIAERRYLTLDEYKKMRDKLSPGDVEIEMEKMSKSHYNVVSPDEIIPKFGVDTMRIYILFIGPPERDAEWSDEAVMGAYRFLGKFWYLATSYHEVLQNVKNDVAALGELPAPLKTVHRKTHQTIKKVTSDMEGNFQFNTATAAIMELINTIRDYGEYKSDAEYAVLKEGLESIALLLSPMAPHISEEIWHLLGHKASIFQSKWPDYDEAAARDEEVEIALQVNGKIRSRITIPTTLSKEEIEKVALADAKIQETLAGKTPRKVIVVPNNLVNIVM
jgi:leucyl-tRNA synthetase